jgi:hypothetical protein
MQIDKCLVHNLHSTEPATTNTIIGTFTTCTCRVYFRISLKRGLTQSSKLQEGANTNPRGVIPN